MAAAQWLPAPTLNTQLVRQYAQFNVFQLMRLLLLKQGRQCWGVSERLRIKADLSAAFPAREVTALKRSTRLPDYRVRSLGEVPRLPERIAFYTPNFSVASALGPLPEPFLEWVQDLQREGAGAAAAFLDIFNHRVNVLRYQFKQRQHPGLEWCDPESGAYAAALSALMGMRFNVAEQLPLPKRAWLGLAGLLSNRRKSVEVAQHILSAYLGVAVKIDAQRGAWRALHVADQSRLGRRQGVRLGQDSLLGSRMWDPLAGLRLLIDELDYPRFAALLPLRDRPNGPAFKGFVSLVRLLLPWHKQCEVVLRLRTSSLPAQTPLSSPQGLGLRLSQTAWLAQTATASPAVREVCFSLPNLFADGTADSAERAAV